MKIISKIIILFLTVGTSSCAMIFGDKNDSVSISSNPPGANIFIEGRNYGQTPATINIEAKNQVVTLTKEGYGSTQLQLETWAAIKDKGCAADMMTSMLLIPLYSLLWSGNCYEFKEENYNVVIPQSSTRAYHKPQDQNRNYYYNNTQIDPNQDYYGRQYRY